MSQPLQPVCVVPCAGSGQRARTALPKQYQPVAGEPMVMHTLKALSQVQQLASIHVIVTPGDAVLQGHLSRAAWDVSRIRVLAAGGATRALSVQAGLQALLEQGLDAQTWVLVHDAARCLIVPADVRRLIELGCNDPVGALLARPMSDTVKRAQMSASPPRVSHTEDREGLWLAQTPQMFRLGQLATAYAQAGTEVTDEASAMQAMGLQPLLVASEGLNLKVTYPQDFEWASAWLHRHTHKDAS